MKIISIVFFLYVTSIFGQNQQIELKIDSIASLDSIPTERKFTINYHIENLTDKERITRGFDMSEEAQAKRKEEEEILIDTLRKEMKRGVSENKENISEELTHL